MIGWLKRAAIAIAAVALAVLAAFGMGKREARRDERLRDAEDHIRTQGRVDDAIEDSRRDGAGWHERLRRAADKRDGPL